MVLCCVGPDSHVGSPSTQQFTIWVLSWSHYPYCNTAGGSSSLIGSTLHLPSLTSVGSGSYYVPQAHSEQTDSSHLMDSLVLLTISQYNPFGFIRFWLLPMFGDKWVLSSYGLAHPPSLNTLWCHLVPSAQTGDYKSESVRPLPKTGFCITKVERGLSNLHIS